MRENISDTSSGAGDTVRQKKRRAAPVKTAHLKTFFINVLTSGKPIDVSDGTKMITIGRYTLLNFLVLMAALLLVLFYALDGSSGSPYLIPVMIVLVIFVVTSFIIARTDAPFIIAAVTIVFVYWFFCIVMTQTGMAGISSVIWSVALPVMAVFLLGNALGSIASLSLFAVLAALNLVPGLLAFEYPAEYIIRIACAYLFVFSMALVVNRASEIRNDLVYQLTSSIKLERDEMELMKDNLKTGVFILDENYVIQPYYSRALVHILDQEELAGIDFTMILQSSLQKREIETLKDYFAMVVNRSFDVKMLEDVNPIQQFSYITAVGLQKTLRTSFTSLHRPEGKTYLLCTIEDHTHEAELERQLSEEDSRRQEEMKSFFEVVHIEPRVLNDFIEEADLEFEHVNTMLKNKDRPAKSILLDMYQSVHAIKANATILGLDSFAEKLHKLEDSIRTYTDSEEDNASFQDVLRIMFELDALMKVNDELRGIIEKIKAFSEGDRRMQSNQVLIQTLRRIVDRLQHDLGKQCELVIRQIDVHGIDGATRRLLKEVLVQLVRNAMYHGIELPDVRTACGKKAPGTIAVSVELVETDKKVRVQVADDGAGIDFKSIKLRAKERQLLSEPHEFADKNRLAKVLFMPGFSTVSETDIHAGRGVGLNLVHDRVKKAGGTIQLQTEEQKGTIFTIILPYKETE